MRKLITGVLLPVGMLPIFVLAQGVAIPLADRPVREVINAYEAHGYEFLYSTGLVRPSLRLRYEPQVGDPIERFKQALEFVGLTLTQNDSGVWLIVDFDVVPRTQTLAGRVLDADTHEPLEGVRVEIAGEAFITDSKGNFRLSLSAIGPVFVSHEGYEKKRIHRSSDERVLHEIFLAPAPPMDEIVVISSRYAVKLSGAGSHLVDLELMDSIPSLGEDPMRIASHLPGMATIGVSAKPHIRGGLQDELLVLFNNVELLEPFHLRDFQSVFSSFNSSLIQSIDVYTGGFPARYGDRMSGVMDINTVDTHRSASGEVSLSLLNTGILLHGEAPKGRGGWVMSGRRGNLDIVTKEINSGLGEPAYSDWFAQYRYQLDTVTELDVGMIGYNDDIQLSDFDVDGEVAESRYRNFYSWAQLHRLWSPRLAGTTLLYYGSIQHNRDGFLFDEDLDNGEANVDDRREFEVWSLGHFFNYEYSSDIYAEFGVRYTYQAGRYDYSARIERGKLADFLGNTLVEQRAYQLRPKGSGGGAYASLRLQPWGNFLVETGLRWDFQDYADGFSDQLSPRLSIRVDVGELAELRFSAGRFFQAEGIHELQVGDGITTYQDAQYADHYIAGWSQQFGGSGFSLSTALFAKSFFKPKRRFENVFNPLVLLPELAADRIEIAPSRARAKGFETTLRYQSGEGLTTWLTYSQSKVEDRLEGRWQPRTWDQGKTVSTGLSWEGDAWTLGATILWHDGWHTTRLPDQIAEDESIEIHRNGSRLRDFVSFDFKISRKWQWQRQSLTAFLEVTNGLNRRNVGGIEFDVEQDEDSEVFLLTAEDEELLPLVPSIGVSWHF